MTCRDEHPTRQNRARRFRIHRTLAIISANWIIRRNRIRVQNAMRAIIQHRKQFHKDIRKLRRKAIKWQKEVMTLRHDLGYILTEHRRCPDRVPSSFWELRVRGLEKKVIIIYGQRYPKETWPKMVPYLNMVALAKWRMWMKSMEKEVARIEAAVDRGEWVMYGEEAEQGKHYEPAAASALNQEGATKMKSKLSAIKAVRRKDNELPGAVIVMSTGRTQGKQTSLPVRRA